MKIVISTGQVRRDLGRRRLAVGGGEALGQRARLQVVLLRAGGLQGVHRQQVAELGGALERQAPGDGGQETGAERVTGPRSEEHTSELQSQSNLVCRLLLEKKKK